VEQVEMSAPLLQVIQAVIVWSANACFLLPPLPLHELFLHQQVDQVLGPVQKLVQV